MGLVPDAYLVEINIIFFFSSRRRHTRLCGADPGGGRNCDWAAHLLSPTVQNSDWVNAADLEWNHCQKNRCAASESTGAGVSVSNLGPVLRRRYRFGRERDREFDPAIQSKILLGRLFINDSISRFGCP